MGHESTQESDVAVAEFPRHAAPLPLDYDTPHAEPAHAHVPVQYTPRTRRSIVLFATVAAIGLVAIFLLVRHVRLGEAAALADEVRSAGEAPLMVDAVRISRADSNALFTL